MEPTINRTVLIISDKLEQFTSTIGLFREAGLYILIAEDAVRGLDLARSEPPVLIICELGLDGLDGRELCRRVRRDATFQDVPIIIVGQTPRNSPIINEAMLLGATEYVQRPFDHVDLFGSGARLLGFQDYEARLGKMANSSTFANPETACSKALAVDEYTYLLERLAILGQEHGAARDLESVFSALLSFAISSVPCVALLISTFDEDAGERRAIFKWNDGIISDVSDLAPIPLDGGPVAMSIRSGEVVVLDNYLDRSAATGDSLLDQRRLRSAVIAPMKAMGKVIGVIEAMSCDEDAYQQEHATAMRLAANLTANAIENVRRFVREQSRAVQREQSQRLESVGRLAGGIAHDFNNMLTAINGYSDLTLRQLDPDDPLRVNVEEIKKAGERSALLTRQLLAFSRRQVLKPRVIDLNQIVTDTSAMLRRMIGEDIELEICLSDDLGSVEADPGQLTQVITNLAVNSRDAMPNGGQITIEVSNQLIDEGYAEKHVAVKAGSYVMLAISDTGVGMTAEVKEHLFEPFYTTKETGQGTGLGLSTVYGIVKQSGGYVWVYSEPNQGSTVKVYLPRADKEIDDLKADEFPQDLHGSETILLVEDEEIVRDLSKQILESCGYHVVEASDGAEASAICQQDDQSFDLLLTDVVMPKMSGRQLVQNLETIRPGLKVLYMSGYTDDSIVRHGVIDPGENYIQKPFTFNGLASKVRKLLDTAVT